jgi:hypothetical protein
VTIPPDPDDLLKINLIALCVAGYGTPDEQARAAEFCE